MSIFYEIVKGIFFFLSVIVGMLLLRGSSLFSPETYAILKQIIVPGYLIFCGLMIGYVIIQLLMVRHEHEDEIFHKHIYTRGFSMGIGVGFILALLYVFV